MCGVSGRTILVDEPPALLRSRDRAAVVPSEDAVSDTRECVVRPVSQNAWHDRDDARQVPGAAQVTRHTKSTLRADVHLFPTDTIRFDEHQRIDTSDFRMPRDHRAREIALECREPERPATIMPEEELHGGDWRLATGDWRLF